MERAVAVDTVGAHVVVVVLLPWLLGIGLTTSERRKRDRVPVRPVKARAVDRQVVRKTIAMDSCILYGSEKGLLTPGC